MTTQTTEPVAQAGRLIGGVKLSPLALTAMRIIDAAWRQGRILSLSVQAADALESAQLLQSPETADELQRLRARVAELEAAAYGDAEVRLLDPIGQIRHLHAAVAAQKHRADTLNWLCREQRERADAAEAQLAADRSVDEDPICYALTEKAAALEEDVTPQVRKLRALLAGQRTAAEVDGITRRIAPLQALREDPHDSPLHHDYRVSRDLPQAGDAS